MSHANEGILRLAFRIYRNAVVQLVRARLTTAYPSDAAARIQQLFAAKLPSGETQWDRLKANALRSRAVPEVSTSVDDDFELLGIADFYNIFQKFFTDLAPSSVLGDSASEKAARDGALRCALQITTLRNPSAHEVTMDQGTDPVLLGIQNMIVLLDFFALHGASDQLRGLRAQLLEEPEEKTATVCCLSVDATTTAIVKHLQSQRIKVATVDGDAAASDTARAFDVLDAGANLVVVCVDGDMATDTQEMRAIRQLVAHAIQTKRPIVVAVGPGIEALSLPADSGELGQLSDARLVRFHPDYEVEATNRIAQRLVASPRQSIRTPIRDSIPVARAVHGDFRVEIVKELLRPELKAVTLVSPWLSDLKGWPGPNDNLGAILAQRRSEGAEITVITRPPEVCPSADQHRILSQLQRDDIAVLVNENLHAKVYLFRTAAFLRWVVGSHNLTRNAVSRWHEVSMSGLRSAEFEEAATAVKLIANKTDTHTLDIWNAMTARKPRIANAH